MWRDIVIILLTILSLLSIGIAALCLFLPSHKKTDDPDYRHRYLNREEW